MTHPDLDALQALLDKARPHASGGIHFSVEGGSDFGLLVPGTPVARDALIDALPALIAYVRELERERVHSIASARRDAEHAAALAMRERCVQACEKVRDKSSGTATECIAAIRALEP